MSLEWSENASKIIESTTIEFTQTVKIQDEITGKIVEIDIPVKETISSEYMEFWKQF